MSKGKSTIWPIAQKLIIVVLILFLSTLIFFLTEKGLNVELNEDYNNLFGVLTATIGTIVAIFFSLILLPLNQIAVKYSPKFLKYIRKDLLLIFVFLFSIFILIYDVIFLFLGSNKYIAVLAISTFSILIILLAISVRHIIKLLNPYYSILKPAHKEIVKTFKKMIPHYRKRCEKIAKRTFKDNTDLIDKVNNCLIKVDDEITNRIQESLLPIREVAIKAINNLDLEQAKNAIQTMMSVVVNYLYSRKKYYTDNDPLLYFLYTEFKLLTQTANNELKIRLHPFIVDCWRRVGIQASVVNVKGMKRTGENFNFLVAYPILGLKELCAVNLLEMDSYASGKACEAMADVGVQLMQEGYDGQAANIIEELKTISMVAEKNKVNHTSGSANYAIMKIYTAGVIFRNNGSQDVYNFTYRKINKSINQLLETFLKTKRNTEDNEILSSFIGNFMDPFKGVNLSRISEYGIFSSDLNKQSIKSNLECIRANIESIKRSLGLLAIHKDWYFSDQAIENLYRVILNLMSYLNKDMAKDHILFYKNHPFTDKELTEKTTEIIIEGASVLGELIIKKADRYLFQNDRLHVFFSVYIIILYEYKLRPSKELEPLFEKTHKLFKELLADYKKLEDSDSNDDFYKYFRILISILKKNNFKKLASDFKIPEFEYRPIGVFASHESKCAKTMCDGQWIIKRPGFQVNGYYYDKIENILKM